MMMLVIWDAMAPIMTSLYWIVLVSAPEVHFAIGDLLNMHGIFDMDV